MKNGSLNPEQQKKRLGWILLLFFITASLPIYYLLQTVYAQLENEAYFSARHQAEKLVDQLELNIQQLLAAEQNRPIAEYSFFNVLENPLLSESTGVKFSPLSVVPAKTDIKGLIGYFQINTDGSFHLPALPEIGQDNISGLSLAELDSRLKLKHRLRDLLSIKITETKNAKADKRIETLEKDSADSVASNQSYIEAFKQKSTIMADDIASPMSVAEQEKNSKKQADYSLKNEVRLAKNRAQVISRSAEKKYKTRKEIVQLPDQNMASSYFNRSNIQSSPMLAEQNQPESGLKDNAVVDNKSTQSAINVLTYESEVSPLQLLAIGQDYFCFYRYVWHDNNRFTQGFIVNNEAFLNAVTENLLNSTRLSSLLFTDKGNPIHKISLADTRQEYTLYSRQLSSPFQKVKLEVFATKLMALPGSLLIDVLAIAIYCLFFIGFLLFYRLGSRQIDLAKQQQNFISAVSHELKTPLTSIRMYGEMLRSGWVADEQKKQHYYDFIFFESERLSRLINNVLQLARLGHQQQNVESVIIPAQKLLDKISQHVEAQIEASSFKLNILPLTQSIKQVNIKVDEDAFFQMVINLVDNAIKFTGQATLKQIDIGFEIAKNKQTAVFFIRDYGPGIKKDQLKKIFQLFYRAGDELTRTTPGTGIGLALVAQLAETMNAKITVENKQPGVKFQINIPLS